MNTDKQKVPLLWPRDLAKEEVDNPMLVYEDFFDCWNLEEARETAWKVFTAMATSNFMQTLDTRERANLVDFSQKIARLMEASHLLHERTQSV